MRTVHVFAPLALVFACLAGCSDDSMTSPSASVEGSDDGAVLSDGLTAGDDASMHVDVAVAADVEGGADVVLPDSAVAADTAADTDALNATDATPPSDTQQQTDAAVSSDSAVVIDAVVSGDGGVPAPFCGNGYCDPGEDSNTCSQDCKGFSWTCGDGVCDIGEEFYCQNDCTKPVCGDGKCEPGEQAQGCTKDCPNSVTCGDNICGVGENGQNCPKDCGVGTWTCGDGKCDIGEQFYCFKDCQATPPDPLGCVQAKCAADYAKCSPDPACASALQCMIACKGDWGCLQGCVQAAGNTGSSAVQVAFCGQQNGCL